MLIRTFHGHADIKRSPVVVKDGAGAANQFDPLTLRLDTIDECDDGRASIDHHTGRGEVCRTDVDRDGHDGQRRALLLTRRRHHALGYASAVRWYMWERSSWGMLPCFADALTCDRFSELGRFGQLRAALTPSMGEERVRLIPCAGPGKLEVGFDAARRGPRLTDGLTFDVGQEFVPVSCVCVHRCPHLPIGCDES